MDFIKNHHIGAKQQPSHNAVKDIDYAQMEICSVCYEVRGWWNYICNAETADLQTMTTEFYQECKCKDSSNATSPDGSHHEWPRFDFNTAVELCYCCGLELLNSGSRWSVWFCDDCKVRVLMLNKNCQRCVIPIGRHSIMNGIGLSGPDADDQSKLNEFVVRVNGLNSSSEQLSQWAKRIVAENLECFGLPSYQGIKLSEYIEAVFESNLDRESAYNKMCRFFAKE